MKEYVVLVQEGQDEDTRWYFSCDADDASHAEEQALDHDTDINVIAVYERVL